MEHVILCCRNICERIFGSVLYELQGCHLRYRRNHPPAWKNTESCHKGCHSEVKRESDQSDNCYRESTIFYRVNYSRNWGRLDGLFNGSFAFHEGKEIYKSSIDKQVLERVHQISNDFQHPLTYLGDSSFKVTHLDHPFVVEAYEHDPWKPELAPPQYWKDQDIYQIFLHCDLEEELSYQSKVPELDFRRWSSGARTCDVNLSNSNKAVGISKLLEKLGIAPDEAVAFGDGLNDMEMLSLVGMGVAMGNARDELKAVANMVTLSAEEDGVRYGLERLGLI